MRSSSRRLGGGLGGGPAGVVAVALCLVFAMDSRAAPPFGVGGDARVDPDDFRITTFATGIDFPLGMVELADGSLLVGTSPPNTPGGSYFDSTGELLRLVDADGDGVSDGAGSVLFSGLPGAVIAVRAAGDLVFVTSAESGSERISLLRRGSTPADALSLEGSIDFSFPAGWSHRRPSVAVREKAGLPGMFDLIINMGSQFNDAAATASVGVSGLITGTVNGDALYRVSIDDTGPSVTAFGLQQIATGLRNAFGLAFDPASGDLYMADNGIDGSPDPSEPKSADETDRIAAAEIGGAIEDFGFPDHYIEYRTGTEIGSGGIDPLVAFQPVPPPNGAESEGPAEIALAPSGFPPGLRFGIFIGFHGKFSLGGAANEENPVVFHDLGSHEYFHFIANTEPAIGHPDSLLATHDSLFVADLSSSGPLTGSGLGAIYQIKALAPPVPALAPGSLAMLVGLLLVVAVGAVVGRTRP